MDEQIASVILGELILITKYGIKGHTNCAEDVECGICLESMHNKPTLEFECGHVFHHHCILCGIIVYKQRNCFRCNKPIRQITKNIFTDKEENPQTNLSDVSLN